jgi:osmotically-inducible protein OsmY
MKKDDSLIKLAVEEELASEAGLDPSKIKVVLKDGVLHISGTVAFLSEKLKAERAASRVVGDKSVRNTLKVKLPFLARRSDDVIHAWCKAALIERDGVPRDAIQARVVNSRVTLDGQVRSKYEKESALDAIYKLFSVVDVIDHIKIGTASKVIPRKPAKLAR